MVEISATHEIQANDFHQTETPFPDDVTLQQLIEEQVRRGPELPAVFCDHEAAPGTNPLTYAGLNERANRVAHALRERGAGPGSIVGIMAERSFAMMAGLFGILKAGAAYLPVSPDDPPDRVAFILRNAGAGLLLVHRPTAAKAPAGLAVIDLDEVSLRGESAGNPPATGGPRDLAYVIYTSGSTGRPKGVMIEHRSVVNRLDWMQRAYPIGPGDVLLQKTPITFDVSVWELFWWALQGAAVCLLKPGGEKTPLVLSDAIRRHRVGVAHFVPSMLGAFLDTLDGRPEKVILNLASLRRVFASGEALSPAHVRKFNRIVGAQTGCRLTNLYGPTEATVDVTAYDCPEGDDIERIPIGRPIQNLRAHVIRDGRVAEAGETGELCLAGVGLARGYLNNPELTAERFVQIPALPGERIYRTGDVARLLPDGNIEYLGREDQQVKIRGLRIELGEIENTIRGFPGVSDCAVVVKKYSESIVVIVAYLAAGPELDQAALKAHLSGRLPAYMVPGHFERIAAIPLTPSGKADRKALPEPRIGGGTA